MRIQVKRFVVGDWENLQEELFLQAQALVASSSSVPFPQHDPSTHKHFFHNLVLRHVGEYFQVTHVLTPFLHPCPSTPPQLLAFYIMN
jgi:hypothetical protein